MPLYQLKDLRAVRFALRIVAEILFWVAFFGGPEKIEAERLAAAFSAGETPM